MKNFFQKIKKRVRFTLLSIGIIVVMLFLFILVWGSLNSARRAPALKSPSGPQSAVTFEAPLKGSSVLDFELPNLFGNKSTNQKTDSEYLNSTNVKEGQLTQRKIIKNGSLSLLVKKAEETAQKIQTLTKDFDGFVASSRVYEVASGIKSATVTIRVPAERFDESMAEIKKLAIKVESENISTSDVTEQFVDYEAQLRNLQAQEVQYLKIMERANTVEEVLKVQQKLGEVRQNIEQIQGKLIFLSRQVDMSTITASLTSEADITILGIRWRPLFVIKKSFRNMVSGLAGYIDAMINFIFFLPRLILWLATIAFLVILAWRVSRWIWRRFISNTASRL